MSFSALNQGITQPYTSNNSSSSIASNSSVSPGIGNMGPPSASMGPPSHSPNQLNNPPPLVTTSLSHIHPPAVTSALSSDASPMPPPSSTPSSLSVSNLTSIAQSNAEVNVEVSNDNTLSTTAASISPITTTTPSGVSVTSIITTGPDGTSLDEVSQQSTLSNASAASCDDSYVPKIREELIGSYHSQSNVTLPGAASINSLPEEYSEMSSPNWQRTSSSPVSIKIN